MEKNKDTLGLHTFMQNRKTLFCYSGPLTEDLLTTISNPVRHQLSDDETKETVAKRVFGVFIEQAQNIIRYSTQKTKSTGDSIGTIAISVADDGFLIEAVNKIDESKKDVLEATLVELSVADQKALRQMYKKRFVMARRKTQRELGSVLLRWQDALSISNLISLSRNKELCSSIEGG